MIEIEERYNGKDSYYLYIVIEKEKRKIVKKVHLKNIQLKDEDNRTFFMIYDSNECVNRDVFKYVNYHLKDKSYHTKELASNALKQLFSFIELFDINYKEITLDDAYRLKVFLYGYSQQEGYMKLNMITQRNSDTINTYINVFRNFYEYLSLYDSPFSQKYAKNIFSKQLTSDNRNTEKYILNDKSSKDNRKVPMYIRTNEMNNILKVIREKYTLREEIIVRLMFECGMRIGEVLGLTLEDISTSPIEMNNNDEIEVCELIIRNRLSDEPYQLAKTCIIPTGKRFYQRNDYNTENTGYQKVYPTKLLMLKIDEYLENIYSNFTQITQKNYENYAKADIVGKGECLEGDNYYLFINKNGKRLHKSGWNKVMRQILLESGLKLDKNIRKHNLNHRFRHGYAMFLRQYKSLSEVDLMYALRHRSLGSVAIYFRPTDEDLYIANEEAVLSMYEVCPLLKI